MEIRSSVVYLGLGSNLGNSIELLDQTIAEIDKTVGQVKAISHYYSSKPYQMESEHDFVNACIRIQTNLNPLELLSKTQDIEKRMGRMEKSFQKIYQDRLIDVDILFFDQQSFKHQELVIPHPDWMNRPFVLRPLLDLCTEISCDGEVFNLRQLINKFPDHQAPKLTKKIF
jgi:2-amino-4-hydroxy-6-hydroxymethyldihydropteridine diphosphokinase